MTKRLTPALTITDARRLRTILDSVGDQSTEGVTVPTAASNSQQVVIRFLENVNPGDYGQKLCALMRFDGAAFVDTKQRIPVRCMSPAGVAASRLKPVQAVARATGQLGLCAEVSLHRQAFLTSDMLAAVDTRRDPSTATALLLNRRANGDLAVSSHTVEVVNRFEDISADSGTYIKVEWIDGEVQPYAANCPSQDSDSGSF